MPVARLNWLEKCCEEQYAALADELRQQGILDDGNK